MLFAIQVHPHDIRDEGADVVAGNIVTRSGIRTIIAETGTLEERHPYPQGELPHNPLHRVVTTEATLEVPLFPERFSGLPISPRLSPAATAGENYLEALTKAARAYGARVLPWVKALNGAFEGDVERVCVQTLDGAMVPTWLCPNHPETETYVWRLLSGIQETNPAPAVLLDRLRYPDWSGAVVNPDRMLTCFCDTCQAKMAMQGIDLRRLKDALRRVKFTIEQPDDGELLPDQEAEEIKQWLDFRRASITGLASRLQNRLDAWARTRNQKVSFWLNLWPPAFAECLGQDYQALGRCCDGAKHFPYHRLGGGADLAGLVKTITRDERQQEKFFKMLVGFLGLPYPLGFPQFQAQGFPVDFVRAETARGKKAFGAGTGIFAGIQIWDTPLNEIAAAAEAACQGGADGLFFYCYGWAPLEALDAVGHVVAGLRGKEGGNAT